MCCRNYRAERCGARAHAKLAQACKCMAPRTESPAVTADTTGPGAGDMAVAISLKGCIVFVCCV